MAVAEAAVISPIHGVGDANIRMLSKVRLVCCISRQPALLIEYTVLQFINIINIMQRGMLQGKMK